jgi:hypothetical protein
MDLSDPTRSISSTLDGTVLAVLAAAGGPMTVGQIAERAARGTEIGVRRSVDRLVLQGTVTATQMGRNRVHELNRDHVAAAAAVVLAGLRLELWRRLRAELGEWDPPPSYACAFGSVARGDGNEDSDIDILLVRPMVTVEPTSGSRIAKAVAAFASAAAQSGSLPDDQEERWARQVDALHDHVQRWTGNSLHVVELTPYQWWRPSFEDRELKESIDHDAVELMSAGG